MIDQSTAISKSSSSSSAAAADAGRRIR
jgi:hypothetical protein